MASSLIARSIQQKPRNVIPVYGGAGTAREYCPSGQVRPLSPSWREVGEEEGTYPQNICGMEAQQC